MGDFFLSQYRLDKFCVQSFPTFCQKYLISFVKIINLINSQKRNSWVANAFPTTRHRRVCALFDKSSFSPQGKSRWGSVSFPPLARAHHFTVFRSGQLREDADARVFEDFEKFFTIIFVSLLENLWKFPEAVENFVGAEVSLISFGVVLLVCYCVGKLFLAGPKSTCLDTRDIFRY